QYAENTLLFCSASLRLRVKCSSRSPARRLLPRAEGVSNRSYDRITARVSLVVLSSPSGQHLRPAYLPIQDNGTLALGSDRDRQTGHCVARLVDHAVEA